MKEIWGLSWKSSFHNKLGHVVCIISSSVLRRSSVKTSLFVLWWVLFVCLFVCFQDTSQIHLAVSQSWSFLLAPTQWPAVRSAQSRKFCSLSLQLTPCLWALVLESSKVESKVPTRSRSTPKPRKHNLRLCRDFCTRSALSSIISRILQV